MAAAMNQTRPVVVDDGDESFHSDGDACNNATPSSDERMKEVEQERATLARKESRIVGYMKAAVFVVFVIAYVLVSGGVHIYITEDQQKNFDSAYTSDALKLLEAFNKAGVRYMEAVDALSVAITSHAKSSGSVFPNVSLPDYVVLFANARVLSSSFMMYYQPLVTDETKAGWEAYALEHLKDHEEAFAAEALLRNRQNALFNISKDNMPAFEDNPINVIYRLDEAGDFVPTIEGQDIGPYLPLWHASPVPVANTIANFDIATHPSFAGAYWETVSSKQAVVGEVVDVQTAALNGTASFFSSGLASSQYRGDVAEYEDDPMSTAAYPVFDSFDLDQRKVVGVVGGSVYWKLHFKNVLPKGTKGIICVLENSKGQAFTYQIDDDVKYIGVGNLHKPKFSHMERNYSHWEPTGSLLETTSFTSAEVNEEYCQYWLRIYPSQETQDQHVNDLALHAVAVVDCVFLFTATVFILYVVAVGRRQRVVMDRALASGAIVSSLFPSQVRDQLYQENETEKKSATQPFFRRDGHDEHNGTGRPIANVYESTTIMFADMVGFTKWSSSRQPVQVFELLETLYQAFDVIAVRRKVFKVETIGDCYVAVAGLPDPQEDHAVIMARFAAACMTKMGQLTTELVDTLGEDTAALAMRVGLHSGSVTGGVLRGQKSRFQLFGDTMNTASRMESNGMPNHIHVSKETANELIAKGKSSWITPREDKIIAKGKGELQTYWVAIRHGSASVVDSLTYSEGQSIDEDGTYWI